MVNKNLNKKNILVVFGSKSDSNVYLPIKKSLTNKKVNFDLRIASAHRSPELLHDVLRKKRYDLIIAGAGLAAHLPGVIASKTIAPVVGIPCNGNFDGLDAFLSISQMPPSIPVLCAPISSNPFSTDFLLKNYDSVKIVGKIKNSRAQKCVEILEKYDIEFNEKNPLIINFFDLKKDSPIKDAINVALIDKENSKDALLFFKKAKTGFFVGLNRGDNAAYMAISMINRLPLAEFREELERNAEIDDKENRYFAK